MNTDIFVNMVTGKLGRTTIGQSRPVFYLGESSLVNFYFEDLPDTGTAGQAADGYSATVDNVNVSALALSVKIGTRGGASIVTQNTWTNLSAVVAFAQTWGTDTLRVTFTPTPVKGYVTFTIAGTFAVAPQNSDKIYNGGNYQGIYGLLEQYVHIPFRYTTTGVLPPSASESDIEDHILALFKNIVPGVFDSFVVADNSPTLPFSADGWFGIMDGIALKAGLVEPKVRVTNILNNEWTIFCYVPDFELQAVLVHVSADTTSSVGYSNQNWTGGHDAVIVSARGIITITNLQVNNVPGVTAASGKTGTLTFTDGQFTTLMGTAMEKEFWCEVLLDSKTVAEGNILLKKKMT